MLLGYARVSTDDQDLTLQKTALKAAGCRRTFEEKVSGAKRARPELDRMLEQLRDDDVVPHCEGYSPEQQFRNSHDECEARRVGQAAQADSE